MVVWFVWKEAAHLADLVIAENNDHNVNFKQPEALSYPPHCDKPTVTPRNDVRLKCRLHFLHVRSRVNDRAFRDSTVPLNASSS